MINICSIRYSGDYEEVFNENSFGWHFNCFIWCFLIEYNENLGNYALSHRSYLIAWTDRLEIRPLIRRVISTIWKFILKIWRRQVCIYLVKIVYLTDAAVSYLPNGKGNDWHRSLTYEYKIDVRKCLRKHRPKTWNQPGVASSLQSLAGHLNLL